MLFFSEIIYQLLIILPPKDLEFLLKILAGKVLFPA